MQVVPMSSKEQVLGLKISEKFLLFLNWLLKSICPTTFSSSMRSILSPDFISFSASSAFFGAKLKG